MFLEAQELDYGKCSHVKCNEFIATSRETYPGSVSREVDISVYFDLDAIG